MPDYVIVAKLDYVYHNSGTKEQAIQALKRVAVFDERRAAELANDLANELIQKARFVKPSEINRARNWKNLNLSEREQLVRLFHEYITTERRHHVGNTIVGMDTKSSDVLGWHRSPTGVSAREFEYNINSNDFIEVLNTIVHENVHAFQSLGKTSIPEPFLNWATRNYMSSGEAYWDNIMEIEARYIGDLVAKQFARYFGF
jgi:hypothetical protein